MSSIGSLTLIVEAANFSILRQWLRAYAEIRLVSFPNVNSSADTYGIGETLYVRNALATSRLLVTDGTDCKDSYDGRKSIHLQSRPHL